MRLANYAGRLALVSANGIIDVEKASKGRFSADPQMAYEQWARLREWASDANSSVEQELDGASLLAPVPRPRQVFAIALNYREHAAESSVDASTAAPSVFTKFFTSITGPTATVRLPSRKVDWEVELVVCIGEQAEHVPEGRAWRHVAGLMIGQDLSEREVQLAGSAPQFSLGKSFPGFAPIGPLLVTPDELDDPDDLALSCSVGEEELQHGRTRDMIFNVPELIARLSAVCPLLPGDLIFTGTPSGVGVARQPPRFLSAGDVLVSKIEGLGELRNPLVAGSAYEADSHS